MGAASSPSEDPDNVCRGLAGSYELLQGDWDEPCHLVDRDVGVVPPYPSYGYVEHHRCPVVIFEASGDVCAARVAEPWRDWVSARVTFAPRHVHVDVDGDGAAGGGDFSNAEFTSTWQWRAFDLALDETGALTCRAVGTYDYEDSDDYDWSQGFGETAAMVVREPTTDLVLVHPGEREAALPWDQLVLLSARPLSTIADILEPSPQVARWVATGERSAESRLLGNWDEHRGMEYELRIAASTREDTGQSFLNRRVPLAVLDVGPAVRAFDFTELPVAHWGAVELRNVSPCADRACVMVDMYVYDGWGPRGSYISGSVAWQLDTTGSTVVRVTVSSDGASSAELLHVFDPSGRELASLAPKVDEAARTVTFRYDPAGAERVGIEVANWGTSNEPPVYLISTEVR